MVAAWVRYLVRMSTAHARCAVSLPIVHQALETAAQSSILLAYQRDEMYIGKVAKVRVGRWRWW